MSFVRQANFTLKLSPSLIHLMNTKEAEMNRYGYHKSIPILMYVYTCTGNIQENTYENIKFVKRFHKKINRKSKRRRYGVNVESSQ